METLIILLYLAGCTSIWFGVRAQRRGEIIVVKTDRISRLDVQLVKTEDRLKDVTHDLNFIMRFVTDPHRHAAIPSGDLRSDVVRCTKTIMLTPCDRVYYTITDENWHNNLRNPAFFDRIRHEMRELWARNADKVLEQIFSNQRR